MRLTDQEILIANLRGGIHPRAREYMTKEEAYEILKEITHQDFGYDAEQWEAWCKQNEEEVVTGIQERERKKYLPRSRKSREKLAKLSDEQVRQALRRKRGSSAWFNFFSIEPRFGGQTEQPDESELRVFKSLREAILARPGMYLGRALDYEAFYWLILRIMENAVSEEGANQATQVRLAVKAGNRFSIADNGRGMPVDTYYGWIFQVFGRALGADRFDQLMQYLDGGKIVPGEVRNHPDIKIQPIIEVTLSQLFTGQITSECFRYFGHLFCEGAILNTLSREFKATTSAKGKQYVITFTDGKLTQPLHPVGASSEKGTYIEFQPELSLFPGLAFDFEGMSDGIAELATRYQNATFTLVDETTNTSRSFN